MASDARDGLERAVVPPGATNDHERLSAYTVEFTRAYRKVESESGTAVAEAWVVRERAKIERGEDPEWVITADANRRRK